MPMQRRLPKVGFKNPFRREFFAVNVGHIEDTFDAGSTVGLDELRNARLVPRKMALVKVLADGELSKKLQVKAHKFSAAAKEKIEKAGGSVEIIEA